MKPLEKLSQDESEWGPTRIEWLFRDDKKLQKLNKARRAQYLESKGISVAAPRSNDISAFRTSSGMLAYRVRIANPFASGSISGPSVGSLEISLPFVSIQHRREG